MCYPRVHLLDLEDLIIVIIIIIIIIILVYCSFPNFINTEVTLPSACWVWSQLNHRNRNYWGGGGGGGGINQLFPSHIDLQKASNSSGTRCPTSPPSKSHPSIEHDVLLPAPRSPVAGFVLVIWKEEQNELEAVSILTAPSSLFTSSVLPESTSFRPGGSDYYYYYCHCLLFFSNFYQHKSDFAKNMLSFKSVGTIETEITGGGDPSALPPVISICRKQHKWQIMPDFIIILQIWSTV